MKGEEERSERLLQMIAHRVCCGTEHNPLSGKLHGYCVVCGVPWPCKYAGPDPPSEEAEKNKAMEEAKKLRPVIEMCDEGQHKFAKLPDHPIYNGRACCPYCMAKRLDELRSKEN